MRQQTGTPAISILMGPTLGGIPKLFIDRGSDPTWSPDGKTVAYHTHDQNEFNRVLGSRGVNRAAFANRAVQVENNLEEIIRAIELNS